MACYFCNWIECSGYWQDQDTWWDKFKWYIDDSLMVAIHSILWERTHVRQSPNCFMCCIVYCFIVRYCLVFYRPVFHRFIVLNCINAILSSHSHHEFWASVGNIYSFILNIRNVPEKKKNMKNYERLSILIVVYKMWLPTKIYTEKMLCFCQVVDWPHTKELQKVLYNWPVVEVYV